MPGTKAAEAERRAQIIAAAFAIARQRGLLDVTIRGVAARAGLSTGLVIFHFGSRDDLLLALLDWMLATTAALSVPPQIEAIADPRERLVALIRQEMARLSNEPPRIRLLFDFWAAGTWNKAIRRRLKADLDRYREGFRPYCEAVLRAGSARVRDAAIDSLTTVTVAFIKGCAVQSMIEPRLDVERFLEGAEELLGAPAGAR